MVLGTVSQLVSSTTSDASTSGKTFVTSASGAGALSPPPPDGAFEQLQGGSASNVGVAETTDSGAANTSQTIINYDYGFRSPRQKTMRSISGPKSASSTSGSRNSCPTRSYPILSTILINELANIDRDIYRLQIAWSNTMLCSPISGTVTGIYKNQGEWVRAGETVVRIEDNSEVLLVADVIYRDRISVGHTR